MRYGIALFLLFFPGLLFADFTFTPGGSNVITIHGGGSNTVLFGTAPPVAVAGSTRCTGVETTGLTSFWKFEEGTGTSVDDAIGSDDLTLVNTPTWLTGGFCNDGALSFASASTEYGQVATPPIINGASAFTVCTWFKSTQGTWGTFHSEGNSGNDTPLYEFGISGSVAGDIIFALRDDSSNSVDFSSGDVGADDGVRHFACVRQNNTASRNIYFDGVIVATNTTSIPGSFTVDLSDVGRLGRLSDTDYYNGALDNLRIYATTALSEDQMDNIYADEQ